MLHDASVDQQVMLDIIKYTPYKAVRLGVCMFPFVSSFGFLLFSVNIQERDQHTHAVLCLMTNTAVATIKCIYLPVC